MLMHCSYVNALFLGLCPTPWLGRVAWNNPAIHPRKNLG